MSLLLQERPLAVETGCVSRDGRCAPPIETRRFRDRDRDQEFSRTIPPLLGRLQAVARRIVGDDELAQDAVQEAILGLWLEPEMPAQPRAWLVRAVTYRSLHLARGRSRRRRHEHRAGRFRPEASDRDDPVRFAESGEWGRIISRTLDQLAADQRSILILSLVDDLDYRSIADVLGVPIGTVRSRLSRARQTLRNSLSGEFPLWGGSDRQEAKSRYSRTSQSSSRRSFLEKV